MLCVNEWSITVKCYHCVLLIINFLKPICGLPHIVAGDCFAPQHTTEFPTQFFFSHIEYQKGFFGFKYLEWKLQMTIRGKPGLLLLYVGTPENNVPQTTGTVQTLELQLCLLFIREWGQEKKKERESCNYFVCLLVQFQVTGIWIKGWWDMARTHKCGWKPK